MTEHQTTSRRCIQRNSSCWGRPRKRQIAQPFYGTPPTTVVACDYHARQYEIERFPIPVRDGARDPTR